MSARRELPPTSPEALAADSLLEAEVEQFEHEARRIAAGGWRRGLIGFLVGALAGLAAALVMPREEGPRRRTPPDRPTPSPRRGSEDGR